MANKGNNKLLDPEKDGLYLSDGKITGCNPNVYSRTILQEFDLILTSGNRFYLYDDGKYVYQDENRLSRLLRDFLHTYQPDCWTIGIEKTYIAGLEREAPREDKLDADRRFLNCQNGMVGLKSLKIYQHDPKYRSTIQLPMDYNPQACCPAFLKMLNQILLGDEDLIAVVQEMFGYCLTTNVKAQKFFLLIGEGANGKSTLIDCLKWIVGAENYSCVSLQDLNNPFNRYSLVDKLLNVVTENEIDGKSFNSEALKSITTGDSITVERKYHDSFAYEPFCKMVFAMNDFPFSRDHTTGLTRRIIAIPFRAQFKSAKDVPDDQGPGPRVFVADKFLKSKLEKEKEGILAWALQGLKRLRANKMEFTEAQAARNLEREYREEIDPTLRFVREHIKQGTISDRITNNDLRETFKSWAEREGHSGLARKTSTRLMSDLKKALTDNGLRFEIGKSGDRHISGIKFHMIRRPFSTFDMEGDGDGDQS